MSSKKCEVCGREEDASHQIVFSRQMNCYLCQKHKGQIYRHGKITDPSPKTTNEKNDIVIKKNYAEIILRNNQQKITGRALIDIEDVEKCRLVKWHLDKNGYVRATKHICLHRYVMGDRKDLPIDHINRNKLDNRKSNLRFVSACENNQNNGAAGVSFDKHAGKWKAEFQLYGKYYSAGTYVTKEEAIAARRKAVLKTKKDKNRLEQEYKEKDKDHATGVRPSPHGRWVAKFCADKKVFHVGTFDTKEEAIVARAMALSAYMENKATA